MRENHCSHAFRPQCPGHRVRWDGKQHRVNSSVFWNAVPPMGTSGSSQSQRWRDTVQRRVFHPSYFTALGVVGSPLSSWHLWTQALLAFIPSWVPLDIWKTHSDKEALSFKSIVGTFPSVPLVKNSPFQCKGFEFNPWSRKQEPTCHGATKHMCHN